MDLLHVSQVSFTQTCVISCAVCCLTMFSLPPPLFGLFEFFSERLSGKVIVLRLETLSPFQGTSF